MKSSNKHQRGSALIEVLVAVLIFSIGLLGLVGLQTRAMQYSSDADGTGTAALLANEAAAQMFTLRTVNFEAAAPAQFEAWKAKVKNPINGLPAGDVELVFTPATVDLPESATITVSWQNPTDKSPRTYTTIVSGVAGVENP